MGLGESTVIALASGGDFTENFSHEFQTLCESGEDTLFYSEKEYIYYNKEVAPSKAPKIDETDKEMKPMEDVEGRGIIGVDELAKYLKYRVKKLPKLYFTKMRRVKSLRPWCEVDMTLTKTN